MRYILILAVAIECSGCSATPAWFDVPYSDSGVPLANSIVQRIRCELAELVRDDIEPQYNRRATLLEYDYHTSMLLSLDANATGGVAPALTFPYSVVSWSITPNLKLSRQDQINYSLKFSMREVYKQWHANPKAFECPDPDTNLAGNMGIRQKISSALNLSDLAYVTEAQPTAGMFSGIINFTATKAINQGGPTWTLTHFSGPGPFLSASLVNTDKLSFGFAAGKNANQPYTRRDRAVAAGLADQALERALTTDLGTQLNAIRNNLR